MMKPKLFLLVLWCCLGGCASLTGAADSCEDAEVPDEIAYLVNESCTGNQFSSLKLGEYFEAQAANLNDESFYEKAARYYTLAAVTSSGQTYIYIPGAGKVPGYTMPVQTGPPTSGLAEAKYRLGLLYKSGRGVKQDHDLAVSYLKSAAKQGHVQAREELGNK